MLTLPMRKRLVGVLLPLLVAIAAVGTPFTATNVAAAEEGHIMATEQVYVRTGPGTDYAIIGSLYGGDWVWSTGNVENGFFEIYFEGYLGYAHSDYISADGTPAVTESGPAESAPAPEPEPEPVAAGPGQQVADFALQFHGYPYVWAGNTPSGFDCSGFTQYVIQNTLGKDITHSADIQATMGAAVGWGDWQVGDLVFFSGTGASGYYSHVGIYIGDGNMIHAENAGTGVVISSLYSDYYSSHYAYAVRLG